MYDGRKNYIWVRWRPAAAGGEEETLTVEGEGKEGETAVDGREVVIGEREREKKENYRWGRKCYGGEQITAAEGGIEARQGAERKKMEVVRNGCRWAG